MSSSFFVVGLLIRGRLFDRGLPVGVFKVGVGLELLQEVALEAVLARAWALEAADGSPLLLDQGRSRRHRMLGQLRLLPPAARIALASAARLGLFCCCCLLAAVFLLLFSCCCFVAVVLLLLFCCCCFVAVVDLVLFFILFSFQQ